MINQLTIIINMQITDIEAFILESPYENTAPEGSEAVSYTHLDVYKRQVYNSLITMYDC